MEWVIAFLNFLKSLLTFSHSARVSPVLTLAIMGTLFYPMFPIPHPPPRVGLIWPQRKHGESSLDAAWPAWVWCLKIRAEVETRSLAFSLLKHPRVIPSEILVTPECCHGWAIGPSYSEHPQHLSSSPSSLRNAFLPPPTTFKGTPLSTSSRKPINNQWLGFHIRQELLLTLDLSWDKEAQSLPLCLRWES